MKYTYIDAPMLAGDDPDMDTFAREAATRALNFVFHTHAHTCHKSKSGKWGCRMARPAGHPAPATRVLAITKTCSVSNPDSGLAVDPQFIECACPCCVTTDAAERPQLELDARVARTADGGNPDASLSYELERPLLGSAAIGSPALRALLDTACLRYVTEIVEELSCLTSQPDVGAALRQRLSLVTAPEARDLVNSCRGMSCRNASLIKYSRDCLTATPHHYSWAQARVLTKGAGLYMRKYMVKEAYALAASLSVLLDARQNIGAYPSRAEDGGTDGRATKQFLQRVFNSTTSELAPTQAAATVLGIPSAGHSHSFVYAYIWDAVRLLSILVHGGLLFKRTLTREALLRIRSSILLVRSRLARATLLTTTMTTQETTSP